MSWQPLPQRLVQAVGQSPAAERIADAQTSAYGPVIACARESRLRTTALGHSIHPLLTHLPLGCWMSVTLLDLMGGKESRSAAIRLLEVGLLAAAPTAYAGTVDWVQMSGDERRIGAVHALGTDLAGACFTGSLVARLRGRHRAGVLLAVLGNVSAAGAGFLGAHLALAQGTASRL